MYSSIDAPLCEQIDRLYVDSRMTLYDIAHRLHLPLKQVREYACNSRLVLHELHRFCAEHAGRAIVVLDLETTGLPTTRGFNRYFPWTHHQYYNSSRILQTAYTECALGDTVSRDQIHTTLRRPDPLDAFPVPAESIAVHGITPERLAAEGRPLTWIMREGGLEEALERATFIVAHNALFDVNILRNELLREGYAPARITELLPDRKIACTCQMTQFTKLTQLFEWVREDTDTFAAHDAGEDVYALCRILNACIKNLPHK
jgi:DNA polymerase III epsilon subunit-like protein